MQSIERIVLTNSGSGYTTPPVINIIGGNGTGGIATCSIETSLKGIQSFNMTANGVAYAEVPIVTISGIGSDAYISGTSKATAEAVINADNQVSSLRITNPGIGYTQVPTVTIAAPSAATGIGTYQFNEIVRGVSSLTEARVKDWDVDTKILKVSDVGIGATRTGFRPGEVLISTESTWYREQVSYAGTVGVTTNKIVAITTTGLYVGQEVTTQQENIIGTGTTIISLGVGTVFISNDSLNTTSTPGHGWYGSLSGIKTTFAFGITTNTTYTIDSYDGRDTYSNYDSNDEIESEADSFIDFSQSNPFGTY